MCMPAMVEATPSIPLNRLSGSKPQLMIDLSMLVANRGSAPLMAIQAIGLMRWPHVPFSHW